MGTSIPVQKVAGTMVGYLVLTWPKHDMAASSNDEVTENVRRGMPGAPQSVIDDIAGEIKQLHEAMRSGALTQQEFDRKADAGVRKMERIAQDYRTRDPTDVESLRAQLAALQTSTDGDQPWSRSDANATV